MTVDETEHKRIKSQAGMGAEQQRRTGLLVTCSAYGSYRALGCKDAAEARATLYVFERMRAQLGM
jgi:hypothetical protein